MNQVEPDEVRRLLDAHNEGPEDPSRRNVLLWLAGGGASLAGLGWVVNKASKELEYEVIKYNNKTYVAVEGINDRFFEYGLKAPENIGEGHEIMRTRESISGPRSLDNVSRRINGHDPIYGHSSLVPVAVVKQEPTPGLYERIRMRSNSVRKD
ncbi:hypothetical protein ACFLZ6_01570 [Nanoarchaeota archaeon]